MYRESARALKAEIASDVLPRVADRVFSDVLERNVRSATIDAGTATIDGALLEREVRDDVGIALGVVPSSDGAQNKLAVRVQRREIQRTRGILAYLINELERRTRGDYNLRFIGRVAKASGIRAGTPSGAMPAAWNGSLGRPLRPGCSIGHVRVTAGSVGGFFNREGEGNRIFILSNNHVLADEDRASLGDAIVHPAPADGGLNPASRVGSLIDKVDLKGRGAAVANLVDAAICDVEHGIDCDCSITGFGAALTGVRTAPLDEDDRVMKVGRTTGLTHGRVSAIEVDGLRVRYDTGHMRFDGQTEFEGDPLVGPFALGGDSGSLVIDHDGGACGLIFATSQSGGRSGIGLAYANPLEDVLKCLKLSLALPSTRSAGSS